MKVQPQNMVDIFCTFQDCNIYNLTFSFFMKRSSVSFVYTIFCFVVLNSSGNQFHRCTNICIPKVTDATSVVSGGYQLLLSNICFVFKSKNEFSLEICKVRYLKKKRLSGGKCSTQGCEWKILIKKQITKPFLEEMFQPAGSKSLRLRKATFEMQLSLGVWGSPFKCPPTLCGKTISCLHRESA